MSKFAPWTPSVLHQCSAPSHCSRHRRTEMGGNDGHKIRTVYYSWIQNLKKIKSSFWHIYQYLRLLTHSIKLFRNNSNILRMSKIAPSIFLCGAIFGQKSKLLNKLEIIYFKLSRYICILLSKDPCYNAAKNIWYLRVIF